MIRKCFKVLAYTLVLTLFASSLMSPINVSAKEYPGTPDEMRGDKAAIEAEMEELANISGDLGGRQTEASVKVSEAEQAYNSAKALLDPLKEEFLDYLQSTMNEVQGDMEALEAAGELGDEAREYYDQILTVLNGITLDNIDSHLADENDPIWYNPSTGASVKELLPNLKEARDAVAYAEIRLGSAIQDLEEINIEVERFYARVEAAQERYDLYHNQPYQIVDGYDNQEYDGTSDYVTVVADSDPAYVDAVILCGEGLIKDVTDSAVLSKGSTIVTLPKDLFNNLPLGGYSVQIDFIDGSVASTLNFVQPEVIEEPGDDSSSEPGEEAESDSSSGSGEESGESSSSDLDNDSNSQPIDESDSSADDSDSSKGDSDSTNMAKDDEDSSQGEGAQENNSNDTSATEEAQDNNQNSPPTGDFAPIGALISMFGASGIGTCSILIYRKKKR